MATALPLRIFLATPGDLSTEREVVRTCVEEHNRQQAGDGGVTYEIVGWPQVRGTARRAQEAINELISESHFTIVLFKDKWGSAPGSPWGYTSGTEEELFTSLLELGQGDQPMRDVWVAFLDHPSPDARVAALRDQMTRTHSIMYEAISNNQDLKTHLSQRLGAWTSLAARRKEARHVELQASSGKDVLRAASLRINGEKLIELGQADRGNLMLVESAHLGGPVENLAYAKALARQGKYDEALAPAQTAINFFAENDSLLFSPAAAEAFARQASILRRQGKKLDAVGRLHQALTLIGTEDEAVLTVRCRILDELGLAYQSLERLDLAREHLSESLQLRRTSGDHLAVSQSLINLARLAIAENDLDGANSNALEVQNLLHNTAPSALHANAASLMAQLRRRQERPADGVPHAREALSINRQVASKHGEAIALLLLSQCLGEAGDQAEALTCAQQCREVNVEMDNESGIQKAEGQISLLTQAMTDVRD